MGGDQAPTNASDQGADRIDTTIAPPRAIAKRTAAKKARPAAVVDEAATKPRPRDKAGRVLDQWGLPLNGPARIRALDALGKRDPHSNPEDWPDHSAAEE